MVTNITGPQMQNNVNIINQFSEALSILGIRGVFMSFENEQKLCKVFLYILICYEM